MPPEGIASHWQRKLSAYRGGYSLSVPPGGSARNKNPVSRRGAHQSYPLKDHIFNGLGKLTALDMATALEIS
jgi:hypothetical protein